MQKMALIFSVMMVAMLAGCNWNKESSTDHPVRDTVEQGVDDVMNGTRDAVDNTIDAVDPNVRDTGDTVEVPNNTPGQVNEGTIHNGVNQPNVNNGVTSPGAPAVNQEGIIEDQKDRVDNDKIDNH